MKTALLWSKLPRGWHWLERWDGPIRIAFWSGGPAGHWRVADSLGRKDVRTCEQVGRLFVYIKPATWGDRSP